MAQSALGAALTIPKSALDAIDKADRKLQDIQVTATNAANSVSQAFSGMASNAQSLVGVLDQIIAKLSQVGNTASNANAGLSGISTGLGTAAGSASSAMQDISQLVNSLSQIGGAGSGNIMQAVLAFKRLQESIKNTSGSNIAELKEQIRGLNRTLSDPNANLNKQAQESLVKRKKLLEDELKYQQQMNEERAVSFQKALDRMVSAEQSYNNKQRKLYADRAKDYQNKNYKSNTTYQGALDFSATANTLNRQVRAIEYLKAAKMSLSTTDADYKQKLNTLNEAISRHTQKLKEASAQTKDLQQQTSYMAGYLSRWAQRMAFAFSVDSLKNFADQIVSVRGQFEISQRSLEAILQDKPKADEIFNKTVELAVKSPFRIKDLVDYTRQLSAYRIESDKLYDTTKRLADVSAGLGVDMGRLILAYGQVKAAAYLRGSEVRQFTEAGINMYGELQEYFKEVKGEAYTTAQIVDMISKRQVTFEDVEAVFQRMTDKGGTFYNMQEVQAETLQGKVSNLKDAFDVMLNDIGKSNERAMKTTISLGTTLLNHWEAIANAGKAIISVLALIMLQANKTGVSLKTMWTNTGFTAYSIKGKGALGILANSLKTLGSAAKSAGIMMKDAIIGNLPVVALMAAAGAVSYAVSAYSNYKEKTREAQEESIKLRGELGSLTSSYNQLAQAANDSSQKLTGDKLSKNINDRREALQKLIDTASKNGLTFKIDVETVKDSELNATFRNVEKQYKDFVDSMETIESNYAKNNAWDTWLTDGLNDDADDYKEAVADVLSQSTKMEQVIAIINANYDKATKGTKKYFDEVRAGQKDGESNLDYFQRMYNAIKQINTLGDSNPYNTPDWLKVSKEKLSDLSDSFISLKNKAGELEKEFDAVLGDEISKYKNNPIAIQAIIDKTAATHDWSEYERDLAYRHFGINVTINKSSMEKEVNWIDDYLSNFFAKRRYGVTLVTKEIDDKDALKDFIQKGDDAAAAAKNWRILKKRLLTVAKNQKSIKIDDSIRKLFKAGTIPIGQEKISVSKLRALVNKYMTAAMDEAKEAFGVDPFEKENNKASKAKAKEQRDLLQERISLLKDMNSKYDELIKTESKDAALSISRKYFKEAAQNVGWNVNDILPDDKSVAKRIRELGAQIKDPSKRGSALRMSADIDLKVSEKEYDKLKDDISRNIDEAFSGLDLYKKLKSTGLSDTGIKDMFGDITTSFDELQDKIDDEFNKYIFKAYQAKYGNDFNKWSESVIKQYNSDIANTGKTIKTMFDPDSEVAKSYLSNTKKLNKQVYQEQISVAQELIKAYKTQLSDQLQLDAWYLEERKKLQDNAEIAKNPDLKNELQGNLDAQYKKKSDENKWKDFQNSDMYVRLFDNLDQVSTKALNAMAEKLQEMRDNLKDLDPAQLKAIAEQINKVNDVRNSRNPFEALASSMKEMGKASKELKSLGGVDEYVRLNTQRSDLKGQLETRSKEVKLIRQEYENTVKAEGAESDLASKTKFRLSIARGLRDSLKAQLGLTDRQIAKLGSVMTSEEQAKSKFEKSLDDISSIVSSLHSAFDSLSSSFGESSQTISGAFSALEGGITAVKAYKKGDIAGMISGATGIISGIASIFSNENRINREIERQERTVTRLEAAYNKLKQSMDNAFDTERLYKYNQESVETLKKEQAAYKAMISAEMSRKKPDDSKILSYQQKIDDLSTTIKELGENMTEALGGFGSESSYKSAAEAFSEAWADAFNEGSDALDALNDKFDDYIKNLVTKQGTQRVVGKLIEPLLKEIDKSVSEGSEGGNNGLELTKNELAKIKELGGETMKELDDTLSSLMSALDYKGKNSSSKLSNLQQGIQSVTESTAQALESIINSMRYYLATQQADVRIIRDTLIERLNVSMANVSQDGNNSPMLVELRLQTTVLTEIRDTLSSCVKSGHRLGRSGIKVFMD